MMDENLINQCRKMDRAAQKKMYDLLSPRLYLVCRRYLKQDAEIEDALADAFYTIFTKLDQLKDDAAFEAWTKRIVINQCLLIIRRKPEQQIYVDETHDFLVAQPSESTLEEQDVLKLLEHLPNGAKNVFCLFAIEGYSHREIAQQLGVTEGTSKSQLNVARTQLKQLIELYYNQIPTSDGK